MSLNYWFNYIDESELNMKRFDKTGLAAVTLFNKYGIVPSAIIECGLFKNSELENVIKKSFNKAIAQLKINKFNLNSFFLADIYFLTKPVNTFANKIESAVDLNSLKEIINSLIETNIIIPISLKLNGDLRRLESNSGLHNAMNTNMVLINDATSAFNIEKTLSKIKSSNDKHVSISFYFKVSENDKTKQVQLTLRSFGSDNSMSFDCSYYYVNSKNRSVQDSSNLDCRGKGKELFDYLMNKTSSKNTESISKNYKDIVNACKEKWKDLSNPVNKKNYAIF